MMTQFLGNLFGPVEVGHIFVIVGKTIDAPTSFEINLCNGKSSEDNLPFHMLVQFHREFIIRNSLIEGQWGENEIEENLSGLMVQNPIIPGWEFKIYIMVGVDSFHVAINNREYCTYKFRCGLEDIHAITVLGDVHWLRQVDHRVTFPVPRPAIQYDDDTCAFSADVPRLFSAGHVVVITAIPYGSSSGTFILKFTEGATYKQAFHLSARFQQKVVVVNSMKDNLEWRPDEQRFSKFPFKVDQQFKIAIANTEEDFSVAVNGKLCCRYQYRSENLFETLTGIKFTTEKGMQIEVTGVDHMNMGMTDCEGFETYSHPDVKLE